MTIPGRPRTTLGSLSLDDLRRSPAWEATRRYEGTDEILEALTLNLDGSGPAEVGEVWCLSRCTLANGSVLPACALYRGDKPDGPDLWTVWVRDRWLRLRLPPAPERALERNGPEAFARALGLDMEAVFPLVVSSEVPFLTAPTWRSAKVTWPSMERS